MCKKILKMEFNACDIKKLADLLKVEGEDSSSDDDIPRCSKLGPGDIQPKSKINIRVPDEDNETEKSKKTKKDPQDIWDIEEVQVVPFCDDASYDPRPRPEFDIRYRQAVSSEDVFLQLGRKTPATASCEVMVIEMCLEGERKEDIDLQVTKHHLDLRSPMYRLSLPLPHPADPDHSTAEWQTTKSLLTVSVALTRDLDFVNF
ncbi:dynein axonemal assembly factor 6 [Macrosteles quadrilineatus]|uniref:dynein axonemal assembly factor 6 n=1 Tax=Macrosteles quadrilineatus TaxID=74068 RepID=UPI0023E12676|nr:dynein axonemal assembly factor 6 [Macrosteles quadrilineatus]